MSYERPLLATLLALLSRPTPVIHVLIGPRQVGKTTIARQIEQAIGIPTIYATADSPTPLTSAWIETHWRRAFSESTTSQVPVLLIRLAVRGVLRDTYQPGIGRARPPAQNGAEIDVAVGATPAMIVNRVMVAALAAVPEGDADYLALGA